MVGDAVGIAAGGGAADEHAERIPSGKGFAGGVIKIIRRYMRGFGAVETWNKWVTSGIQWELRGGW